MRFAGYVLWLGTVATFSAEGGKNDPWAVLKSPSGTNAKITDDIELSCWYDRGNDADLREVIITSFSSMGLYLKERTLYSLDFSTLDYKPGTFCERHCEMKHGKPENRMSFIEIKFQPYLLFTRSVMECVLTDSKGHVKYRSKRKTVDIMLPPVVNIMAFRTDGNKTVVTPVCDGVFPLQTERLVCYDTESNPKVYESTWTTHNGKPVKYNQTSVIFCQHATVIRPKDNPTVDKFKCTMGHETGKKVCETSRSTSGTNWNPIVTISNNKPGQVRVNSQLLLECWYYPQKRPYEPLTAYVTVESGDEKLPGLNDSSSTLVKYDIRNRQVRYSQVFCKKCYATKGPWKSATWLNVIIPTIGYKTLKYTCTFRGENTKVSTKPLAIEMNGGRPGIVIIVTLGSKEKRTKTLCNETLPEDSYVSGIACAVVPVAHPPPQVKWTKDNNENVNLPMKSPYLKFDAETVTYRRIYELNNNDTKVIGSLACRAKNAYGTTICRIQMKDAEVESKWGEKLKGGGSQSRYQWNRCLFMVPNLLGLLFTQI